MACIELELVALECGHEPLGSADTSALGSADTSALGRLGSADMSALGLAPVQGQHRGFGTESAAEFDPSRTRINRLGRSRFTQRAPRGAFVHLARIEGTHRPAARPTNARHACLSLVPG